MAKCPECGNEVDENTKYCPKCGSSVGKGGFSNKSIIAVVFIVLIIGGIAGGYALLSGDGGSSDSSGNGSNGKNGEEKIGNINSIDLRISGMEGGIFKGGFRFRARDIQKDTPEVRIDDLESDDYLIYKGNQDSYYACSEDSCFEIPNSQGNIYANLLEKVQEWGKKGTGTYKLTYQEWTVEVKVKSVNTPFSEDLFKAPENVTSPS